MCATVAAATVFASYICIIKLKITQKKKKKSF